MQILIWLGFIILTAFGRPSDRDVTNGLANYQLDDRPSEAVIENLQRLGFRYKSLPAYGKGPGAVPLIYEPYGDIAGQVYRSDDYYKFGEPYGRVVSCHFPCL